MQVMLNRLKAGAGHWHELAKLLPVLAALGVDATVVEASTGLERVAQNAWTVSLQVNLSLLLVWASYQLASIRETRCPCNEVWWLWGKTFCLHLLDCARIDWRRVH